MPFNIVIQVRSLFNPLDIVDLLKYRALVELKP